MDQEIKTLLEKNIKLTEDVYKMTKKISKFIFWQRIFGILKILIILIPIILGIIYLPSLIKNFTKQYQELLAVDNTDLLKFKEILKIHK